LRSRTSAPSGNTAGRSARIINAAIALSASLYILRQDVAVAQLGAEVNLPPRGGQRCPPFDVEEKDNNMILKNRLADIRTSKGLSQEALAREVGLSRNSISSIERGEFIPLVLHVLKIVKVLGVTAEEVFYLEDEK